MIRGLARVGKRAFVTACTPQVQYKDIFAHLTADPPDPIFGIVEDFIRDKDPKKINLSIGVYRTAEGKPHQYRAVQKAEDELSRFGSHKDYLPPSGDPLFVKLNREMIFGPGHPDLDRVP
jgi:aspartate/tyrosine/aromatic aminotransferase